MRRLLERCQCEQDHTAVHRHCTMHYHLLQTQHWPGLLSSVHISSESTCPAFVGSLTLPPPPSPHGLEVMKTMGYTQIAWNFRFRHNVFQTSAMWFNLEAAMTVYKETSDWPFRGILLLGVNLTNENLYVWFWSITKECYAGFPDRSTLYRVFLRCLEVELSAF